MNSFESTLARKGLWQGTGYDAHRGGQVRVHLKDEAARPWLSSLVTVDLRVTNERFIGSVLQALWARPVNRRDICVTRG